MTSRGNRSKYVPISDNNNTVTPANTIKTRSTVGNKVSLMDDENNIHNNTSNNYPTPTTTPFTPAVLQASLTVKNALLSNPPVSKPSTNVSSVENITMKKQRSGIVPKKNTAITNVNFSHPPHASFVLSGQTTLSITMAGKPPLSVDSLLPLRASSSSSSTLTVPNVTNKTTATVSSLATLLTHPIRKVTSIEDTEDEVKWHLDQQQQQLLLLHQEEEEPREEDDETIHDKGILMTTNKTFIPSSTVTMDDGTTTTKIPPTPSTTTTTTDLPPLASLIREWSNEIYALGQNLRCPICLSIMTDPSSPDCGHTYCHDCIATQIKINDACPQCRKFMSIRQLKKDTTMANIIHAYRGLVSEGMRVRNTSTTIPVSKTVGIVPEKKQTTVPLIVSSTNDNVDNDSNYGSDNNNNNNNDDDDDNDNYQNYTLNNTSFMMFTQIPDVHDIEEGFQTIIASTHTDSTHTDDNTNNGNLNNHQVNNYLNDRRIMNTKDAMDEEQHSLLPITLLSSPKSPLTSIHNTSTESTATIVSSHASTGPPPKSILVSAANRTNDDMDTDTNIDTTLRTQTTLRPRFSVKFAPDAFDQVENVMMEEEQEDTTKRVTTPSMANGQTPSSSMTISPSDTDTTLNSLSSVLPIIYNKIQGCCASCYSHRLYSPDRGYLRTCTNCQITMHSLCAMDFTPIQFVPHASTLKVPVPWQCNVCTNHLTRENLKCELCPCSSPWLLSQFIHEILQYHPKTADEVQQLILSHTTKNKSNNINNRSTKSSEKKRLRDTTKSKTKGNDISSSSSSALVLSSPEEILTVRTTTEIDPYSLVPWIQNSVNPNKWVHLVCAKWVPFVQFVYIKHSMRVNLQAAINSAALQLENNTCHGCGFGTHESLVYGITVPCSVPSCTKRYHVMCAVRAKLMLMCHREKNTVSSSVSMPTHNRNKSSSSSSVSSYSTLLDPVNGPTIPSNTNMIFDNESQADPVAEDTNETTPVISSRGDDEEESYLLKYCPVSTSVVLLPTVTNDPSTAVALPKSPSSTSSSNEMVYYLFCNDHTPQVIEERSQYKDRLKQKKESKMQEIKAKEAYEQEKITLAQSNLSMAYKLMHEQQEHGTLSTTVSKEDSNGLSSSSSSSASNTTYSSSSSSSSSSSTVPLQTNGINRYVCGSIDDKLGPGMGILMGFRSPSLPQLPLPSKLYEKVTSLASSSSASSRTNRHSTIANSNMNFLFDDVWGAFTVADGGKQDIDYANEIIQLGGIMRYIPDKYVNGIIVKGSNGANRRTKKDKETIQTQDILLNRHEYATTTENSLLMIYRSLPTPIFPLTHTVIPATKISTEWSLLGKTSKDLRYFRSILPSKHYEDMYTNDVNNFLNSILEKSITVTSGTVSRSSSTSNNKTPQTTSKGRRSSTTSTPGTSSSSSTVLSTSSSSSSTATTMVNNFTTYTVTTWLARRQSQRYLAGLMNGCYLVTTEWLESCARECNGAIAHERPYLVAGDRESMHSCPPLRSGILFGPQVYNLVNKYSLLASTASSNVRSSSSTPNSNAVSRSSNKSTIVPSTGDTTAPSSLLFGSYPYELSAPGRARKAIESKDPKALLFSGITFILWGEWENPPKNVSTMDACELITLGGGRVIDLDLHTIPKEAIPSLEEFIKATRTEFSTETKEDTVLKGGNNPSSSSISSSSNGNSTTVRNNTRGKDIVSSSSSTLTIPLRTTSGLYKPLDTRILQKYGLDSAEWSSILLHIASLYPHLVLQTPKRTKLPNNDQDTNPFNSSIVAPVTIPPIVILCDEPHFSLPESLISLIKQLPHLLTILTPNWLYDCASTYSLLYPSVALNHIHPAYEPYT